jgi:hypothetical protein
MRRLAAVTLVVLAATIGSQAAAAAHGGLTDARHFDPFRVYFAGKRVLGLRLARIDVLGDGRRAEIVAQYGKCEDSPGGGCGYELQISSTSICRTYPGIYFSPPKLRPIRGARGGWVRTARIFDVYTGHTAVSILGPSQHRAERVAFELENVRRGRREPLLPAVKQKFLDGRARCQRGQPIPAR